MSSYFMINGFSSIFCNIVSFSDAIRYEELQGSNYMDFFIPEKIKIYVSYISFSAISINRPQKHKYQHAGANTKCILT